MKHTKRNSAEAYSQIKSSTVPERIRATLLEYPFCTRRQLHNLTGIEIATLCGAIAKMEKRGEVTTNFSTECEHTGKLVAVYELKEHR